LRSSDWSFLCISVGGTWCRFPCRDSRGMGFAPMFFPSPSKESVPCSMSRFRFPRLVAASLPLVILAGSSPLRLNSGLLLSNSTRSASPFNICLPNLAAASNCSSGIFPNPGFSTLDIRPLVSTVGSSGARGRQWPFCTGDMGFSKCQPVAINGNLRLNIPTSASDLDDAAAGASHSFSDSGS
jgi:hypothetical protein